MYGYIYLTVDTKRNEVYVGQHKAEAYDPTYLGSGVKLFNKIKVRPHTLRNYVIEWCEDKQSLNKAEIEWIKLFRNECKTINITEGGTGGNTFQGRKHSKETKRKISDSLKGNKRFQGRKHSKETLLKMSETHKHIVRTEEWKRHISEAKKGKHLSLESRLKMRAAQFLRRNPSPTKTLF